jgi:hypothetical protein
MYRDISLRRTAEGFHIAGDTMINYRVKLGIAEYLRFIHVRFTQCLSAANIDDDANEEVAYGFEAMFWTVTHS